VETKYLLPPKKPVPAAPALRVSYKDPLAPYKVAQTILDLLTPLGFNVRERGILCIGSDRSTGDALGPLVGTILSSSPLSRTTVWGTLKDPVHALNLEALLKKLAQDKNQHLIIAIDASLGKSGSVGMIEIGRGALYPGAGVKKELPPVGDLYLSGVVNLGGFMEQMVLQSTRLYQVMELAKVIAQGLLLALNRS